MSTLSLEISNGHARPPREAFKIHGISLPQGHYAVCIDNFHECNKLLRIPVPISSVDITPSRTHMGHMWLGHSNGYSLEFGDAVLQKFAHAHKSHELSKGKGNELSKGKGNELSKEKDKELSKEKGKELSKEKGKERSNEKGKKELVKAKSSKGSAPEPLIEPLIELVNKNILSSLSETCNWLHTCAMWLPLGGIVKVDLETSMLNHSSDTSEVFLSKEDFSEFLAGQKLSATIITTFIRILNDELKKDKKDARVGWLCPFTIRGDQCMKAKEKVRAYILGSFRKYREQARDLIIAPYIQGVWRELTDDGGRQHPASTRNFEWIYLKCAQQNDVEACGYYTMRNMNDLVLCVLGVVSLEDVLNHTNLRSLTKDQIDVVRDKFALFITDNFI